MRGIFSIFGRSQEIQRLDRALRAVGLHPALVSDAVKITVTKQLKEASGGRAPDERAVAAAAELIGYCALGREAFAENNGEDWTRSVENRLVDAIEAERGIDARLVLLALHSRLTHPSVIERFQLKLE
jgi:hypothetical protein